MSSVLINLFINIKLNILNSMANLSNITGVFESQCQDQLTTRVKNEMVLTHNYAQDFKLINEREDQSIEIKIFPNNLYENNIINNNICFVPIYVYGPNNDCGINYQGSVISSDNAVSPILPTESVLLKEETIDNKESKAGILKDNVAECDLENLVETYVLRFKKEKISTDQTVDVMNNSDGIVEPVNETDSGSSVKTIQHKEKKHRNSISMQNKERLVEAFLNGEDVYMLGSEMNIKEDTVKNLLYNYKKLGTVSKGKRGGYKPSKIRDEVGEKLLEFLENSPEATLKDMKKFLEVKHNVLCSVSTVDRFLSGKFYSVNKLGGSLEEKNTERVKTLRMEYVVNYLEKEWQSSECVYIDDIGFNIYMWRSQLGLPIPNTNLIIPAKCRGRSVSLLMAISKNGPVHFKITMGNLVFADYQGFIAELSGKVPSATRYLIHDNPYINKNMSSTHQIVNLPPFSPFLNPIQAVFQKIKKEVQSELSRQPKITQMQQSERLDLMINVLVKTLQSEQLADLREHYRLIKRFYPKCILKVDMIDN